jgi:hypothetical protein
MREFFEIINEYPWTTFWLMVFTAVVIVMVKNKEGGTQ